MTYNKEDYTAMEAYTDAIAFEYSKKNPDRAKIVMYAEKFAKHKQRAQQLEAKQLGLV